MSGHAIGYGFEGIVDIALQSSTTEASAANDSNASASVLGATHAIDSKSDEAAYWRARWREAIAKEEDLSNRLAIAEESLEKSEAERRALIAERVSSSGERRAEARQAGADKGVLCAAMSELTLLRAHAANSKERLEAAEAERDQAVRKAKALAQELAGGADSMHAARTDKTYNSHKDRHAARIQRAWKRISCCGSCAFGLSSKSDNLKGREQLCVAEYSIHEDVSARSWHLENIGFALAEFLASCSDAPGYADGAAVAVMREQLTRAMSRKESGPLTLALSLSHSLSHTHIYTLAHACAQTFACALFHAQPCLPWRALLYPPRRSCLFCLPVPADAWLDPPRRFPLFSLAFTFQSFYAFINM
eukprot:6174692-Pleurochrysis_carterae.AAC.1